jgi:hypothetical protein
MFRHDNNLHCISKHLKYLGVVAQSIGTVEASLRDSVFPFVSSKRVCRRRPRPPSTLFPATPPPEPAAGSPCGSGDGGGEASSIHSFPLIPRRGLLAQDGGPALETATATATAHRGRQWPEGDGDGASRGQWPDPAFPWPELGEHGAAGKRGRTTAAQAAGEGGRPSGR